MLTAAEARKMSKNGVAKRDRSIIIVKMIIEMVIRTIEAGESTCISSIFTDDRACDYKTRCKCITMLETLGYKYTLVQPDSNMDMLSWRV